jgi:hypothetical protein
LLDETPIGAALDQGLLSHQAPCERAEHDLDAFIAARHRQRVKHREAERTREAAWRESERRHEAALLGDREGYLEALRGYMGAGRDAALGLRRGAA